MDSLTIYNALLASKVLSGLNLKPFFLQSFAQKKNYTCLDMLSDLMTNCLLASICFQPTLMIPVPDLLLVGLHSSLGLCSPIRAQSLQLSLVHVFSVLFTSFTLYTSILSCFCVLLFLRPSLITGLFLFHPWLSHIFLIFISSFPFVSMNLTVIFHLDFIPVILFLLDWW